jgi:hypothetical protein
MRGTVVGLSGLVACAKPVSLEVDSEPPAAVGVAELEQVCGASPCRAAADIGRDVVFGAGQFSEARVVAFGEGPDAAVGVALRTSGGWRLDPDTVIPTPALTGAEVRFPLIWLDGDVARIHVERTSYGPGGAVHGTTRRFLECRVVDGLADCAAFDVDPELLAEACASACAYNTRAFQSSPMGGGSAVEDPECVAQCEQAPGGAAWAQCLRNLPPDAIVASLTMGMGPAGYCAAKLHQP